MGIFYYKDTTAGTYVITVYRADLILDTQIIVVTSVGEPLIRITKGVRVTRLGGDYETSVNALAGDTIEYRLVMTNIGTASGTNVTLVDTITFDTSGNDTVDYVSMDTAVGPIPADTWAYTLDIPPTGGWIAGTPTPGMNVKGLRWEFHKTIAINESGTITFKVKIR